MTEFAVVSANHAVAAMESTDLESVASETSAITTESISPSVDVGV